MMRLHNTDSSLREPGDGGWLREIGAGRWRGDEVHVSDAS